MVGYMEESGEQFTVVFAFKLRVQCTLHYTVAVVHFMQYLFNAH
jgi:hypothetical protein